MIAARIGKNDMFDKLLATKQIQTIHDLDLFHGLSLKLCGAELSTNTLVQRRTSQEEGCPCIEFVYIMLDRTTFQELQHSVQRSLRLCVGSASAFKLI